MKIRAKKYAGLLYEITKDKNEAEANKVIADFVRLLSHKKALRFKQQIIDAFGKYYNQAEKIAEVIVYSAKGLDPKEEDKLAEIIKKIKEVDQVEVRQEIDEKLIGGIKIRIDDIFLDASLKSQLTKLKNKMIESPSA